MRLPFNRFRVWMLMALVGLLALGLGAYREFIRPVEFCWKGNSVQTSNNVTIALRRFTAARWSRAPAGMDPGFLFYKAKQTSDWYVLHVQYDTTVGGIPIRDAILRGEVEGTGPLVVLFNDQSIGFSQSHSGFAHAHYDDPDNRCSKYDLINGIRPLHRRLGKDVFKVTQTITLKGGRCETMSWEFVAP